MVFCQVIYLLIGQDSSVGYEWFQRRLQLLAVRGAEIDLVEAPLQPDPHRLDVLGGAVEVIDDEDALSGGHRGRCLLAALNARVLKISVLAAIFSASCAGTAMAGSAAQPDAEEIAPILEVAKTSADTLPSFVPAGTKALGTFVPGAERKLTTSDGVDLWVTTTEAGDLCLIGATKDGYSGQTCATPADVAAAGLPLQFISPSGAIEAHLLPDGATIQSLPRGADKAPHSCSPTPMPP